MKEFDYKRAARAVLSQVIEKEVEHLEHPKGWECSNTFLYSYFDEGGGCITTAYLTDDPKVMEQVDEVAEGHKSWTERWLKGEKEDLGRMKYDEDEFIEAIKEELTDFAQRLKNSLAHS